MIAAIEQMKWNHIIAPQQAQENEEEDSDEEIQQLKQSSVESIHVTKEILLEKRDLSYVQDNLILY